MYTAQFTRLGFPVCALSIQTVDFEVKLYTVASFRLELLARLHGPLGVKTDHFTYHS